MSISQNFPSTRPSLNLNFARSQKLDPRITFTRSSTATYTGGDGLIKTAATNTPRFDFNATTGDCLGLLIEESRSNLIIQSETFNTGWSLAGATIGINSTTAPDGTSNADAALEDGTNGQHTVYRDATTSPSSTYTASCFIKAGTRTYGEIFINGAGGAGSGTVAGRFDLTNLTVTSTGNLTLQSSSITSYPNGWYKCSITGSVGGSGSIVRYHVRPSTSTTGDYQGVNGSVGIYIWGAQLEAGAFPTSYIPTVASTVTRSADNASITGTNFSSFYNPSEGSVLFSGRTGGGTEPCFLTFSNAATSPTDIIRYTFLASSTISRFLGLFSSGTIFDIYSANTFTSGSLFKTAGCYKLNDFANVLNGGTVGTDTSGNVPVVNRLHLGDVNGYGTYLNGTISQLLYYPVRLSNSQLQTLTK